MVKLMIQPFKILLMRMMYPFRNQLPLILLIVIFCFFQRSDLFANKCNDILLLDGQETLVSYGMDTTAFWWAMTQPFTGKYRLHINGNATDVYDKFQGLTFAYHANNWACFALKGNQWVLLSSDKIINIPGTSVGEILFSLNSENFIYTYFDGEEEFIRLKDRIVKTYNRIPGKLFTNELGNMIAFLGYRGDKMVININGKESSQFDEIKPVGFWYNNEFIYAGRNGVNWQIYRNFTPITENFADISEIKLNHAGTVLSALVKRHTKDMVGILISDDYYEPLVGRSYDVAYGLALHPEANIMTYKAISGVNNYIVINTVEYYVDEVSSLPEFTYNGEEIYYFSCNVDCSFYIDGKKYPLNSVLNERTRIAHKPKSKTIAYASSTSLIMRNVVNNQLYAGMMVDEIIPPRYNWRLDRYETLGRINNRLYLLTCSD